MAVPVAQPAALELRVSTEHLSIPFDSPSAAWQGRELSAEFPKPGSERPRRLFLLPGLAAVEAGAMAQVLREAEYHREPDASDGKEAFQCNLVEGGVHLLEPMKPLLEELARSRLLPYVAWRYGLESPALSEAFARRYLPSERRRHPTHFDGAAAVTIVIGLDAPEAFEGGLYVQPDCTRRSRRFVPLGLGDVAVHRYDLRHGVRVRAGRRYSLVLWIKPTREAVLQRSLPWYEVDAAAGDADAQYNLARVLQSGRVEGGPCAAQRIRHWLERASAQEHAEAQRALGLLCLRGEGGRVEPTLALQWLRRAAALEDAQAQRALAALLRCGLPGGDARADAEEAARWEARAAAEEESEEDAGAQTTRPAKQRRSVGEAAGPAAGGAPAPASLSLPVEPEMESIMNDLFGE